MNTLAQAPTTLAQLHADQQRVRSLFEDYGNLAADSRSSADRNGLIARLGAVLGALLRVEEELIYPCFGPPVEPATLQAAHSDHLRIKAQLQRIAAASGEGAPLDSLMNELAQSTLSHLNFENERLFDQVPSFDTPALREQAAVRRAELLGEQGPD